MRIDREIPVRDNADIDQAVTADLIQHVLEKRQPGVELTHSRAVEIHLDLDLGFLSIALNARATITHDGLALISGRLIMHDKIPRTNA